MSRCLSYVSMSGLPSPTSSATCSEEKLLSAILWGSLGSLLVHLHSSLYLSYNLSNSVKKFKSTRTYKINIQNNWWNAHKILHNKDVMQRTIFLKRFVPFLRRPSEQSVNTARLPATHWFRKGESKCLLGTITFIDSLTNLLVNYELHIFYLIHFNLN